MLGNLEDLALGDPVRHRSAQADTPVDRLDPDLGLGNGVLDRLLQVRHIGADLDIDQAQEGIPRTVDRHIGTAFGLAQDVKGRVGERNGRRNPRIADHQTADTHTGARVHELTLRDPDFLRHAGVEPERALLRLGQGHRSAIQGHEGTQRQGRP